MLMPGPYPQSFWFNGTWGRRAWEPNFFFSQKKTPCVILTCSPKVENHWITGWEVLSQSVFIRCEVRLIWSFWNLGERIFLIPERHLESQVSLLMDTDRETYCSLLLVTSLNYKASQPEDKGDTEERKQKQLESWSHRTWNLPPSVVQANTNLFLLKCVWVWFVSLAPIGTE